MQRGAGRGGAGGRAGNVAEQTPGRHRSSGGSSGEGQCLMGSGQPGGGGRGERVGREEEEGAGKE